MEDVDFSVESNVVVISDIDTTSIQGCVSWLKEHNLSTSGTLNELQMRINRANLFPTLPATLKKKQEKNFKFDTRLDTHDIPPVTSAWSADENLYPKVNENMFITYCKSKREGSQGQQEKAYAMLNSRKLSSIKCIVTSCNECFVRALIKKSYGDETRAATIKFYESNPVKGYCECAVGISGLCCHVLSILLYLKHFHQTNEKILSLSCTEQLQKWHKRTTKGSIPMVPLRQIRLKSAKITSDKSGKKIEPADADKTKFKRNVLEMKEKVRAEIKKVGVGPTSFETHCFNVLSKHASKSSLMGHLEYKFALSAESALSDHDYTENMTLDKEKISIPDSKRIMVKENISRTLLAKGNNDCDQAIPTFTTQKSFDVMNQIKDQIKNDVIILDLSNVGPFEPSSKNYVQVIQNTDEWMTLRKHKVTGSRLPSLLGVHGSSKYDSYWEIVLEGLPGKVNSLS